MNDQFAKYELYCIANPSFYDIVNDTRDDRQDFAAAGRGVPEGWRHQATDVWLHYAPEDADTPRQGWKIHVSARVADADRAIDTVWDYCVPRRIPFKFLRGLPVMAMLNSKAADRGSSGKLVTIYPRDDDQLELVLKELDVALRGVRGPYVLSDLRYGDGPLHVRYGGFHDRRCLGPNGEPVPAIEDGAGALVPDVRRPAFTVPSWVTLPAFLEPHLAARNAVTVAGLPYRIDDVMQFSNGGGVYLGTETSTGRRVVLKEARPYAGLDAAGRDAVTRLAHERDMLTRLAGLDAAPAPLGHLTVGEHHFLVMEFVDGDPLQRQIVRRYPLTRADCDAPARAAYTQWVLGVLPRIRRAVETLHERGVVFGDLHPSNILLTADDRPVLIDFEVATLAEEPARAALANPAYAAPPDRRGVDVDRYALACLTLGMFAPQATIMLPLDRAKVFGLAELIKETFPVPDPVIDDAVRVITGGRPAPASPAPRFDPVRRPGDWPALRQAMRHAILASATPERRDRLFPGDPAQFRPGGGIGLAYGAAGVLYALKTTGAGRSAEHEEWLLTAARAARGTGRAAGTGFYDGPYGVAYVLDLLGHRQDALDTIGDAIGAERDWESLDLGLFGGLAGIGLALRHFGRTAGEPALTDLSADVTGLCADRLGGPHDVPEISGGDHPRAGLMYGSAGPALLFLRAYEDTGDTALLDLAGDALRQDLRRCGPAHDGSLQVDQGWRTLPYLDEGSVGIALVLARYLTHRHDEALAAALDRLALVTLGGYFVQSGLFTGRAGVIAALAGWAGRHEPELATLTRGLAWHALPYGGGLAFPGDQLLRLSMDFATGTAGVLFALGTVLHDEPVHLPFTEPPGARRLPPIEHRKEV